MSDLLQGRRRQGFMKGEDGEKDGRREAREGPGSQVGSPRRCWACCRLLLPAPASAASWSGRLACQRSGGSA